MRVGWLALTVVLNCSPAGGGVDGSSDVEVSDASSDAAQQETGSDAGAEPATFTYTPQWKTVSAVSVYGGFGQSNDWTMPFLKLTDNGSGTYTGSAMLPPGQYLYVFRVLGDDAADYGVDGGTAGTKSQRYAVDPTNPSYAACPSTSPTYSMVDKNPCSQLTVPQPSPATLVHVTGTVSGGYPIADYLVILERNETGSHHYFVNRVTTAADGKYDLMAAAGQYRLQVQYPSIMSKTDLERDPPTTLAAMRRLISSNFTFASAPVAAPDGEIAFAGYGTFAPTKTATLPTSFTFSGVGTTPTHLDVYGTANDGGAPNIGDPWYQSAATTTGAALFDGGFNVPMKANTPGAVPGERYFWGVEEDIKTDAGIDWTAQTMVFDITWQ